MKSKAYKVDADKLASAPVDLSKLSDLVKKCFLKRCM